MKKALTFCMILTIAVPFLWAQQPQLLPITRVLLYKNGMAYIERAGQITAPLSLTFHPEDMNDVLKSFTAWNPVSNALYSVGYTAGIPSSHMLGRFPFDIRDGNIGLGGFLSQVKGADVRLDIGRPLEGKLAAVQQQDHAIAQQTTTTDYRVTVLGKDGALQTVWLSDVRTVEFVDPNLRDQLRSYLEVLSEGRQDVTREVSVYPVPAAGPIRVSYLQQFPLWKTSYRVDLGPRDGRVQGWAQIDNPTGESWDNVEVSLLSGAPVSFVMNLYDPLYTTRTTVPVPGGQVAAPRQYEAAVREDAAKQAAGTLGRADGQQGQGQGQGQIVTASEFAARGGAPGGAGGGRGGGGGGGGAGRGAGAPGAAAAAPPVFQQASATQIEDFFEYKFPFPVRLASRQSALLPFLQKTMNIERISIFNARTDRGNPQLGARVDNTSDVPFEPGPVTFFEDGRYAGEAVLAYLSRGEKRLVSYGVDHDIQIAAKTQNQPETTTRVTISRGVAVLYMESVLTTSYEIRSKATQNKTLIVEHARIGDRKLKGLDAWETSDNFYRFRVTLTPNQMTTLAVPEIVTRQSNITLSNLVRSQLVMFAGKETPDSVRNRLGQIVDLQEQIANQRNDLNQTESRITQLFRDQERLRENIKALRETREDQDLRTRYIGQLNKQEDDLQAARTHIDSVNKDIASTETRLNELISNLTWGQ